MPPTKPSVLVVDDDPDSREILWEYLTFVGFDVATAPDGETAIARAAELHPHVVLMDLALGGTMDGFEATRRIRAHPVLKNAVVIAVTARAFAKDQQQARHAGCHAVVIKPYDLTALAERINRVVQQGGQAAS